MEAIVVRTFPSMSTLYALANIQTVPIIAAKGVALLTDVRGNADGFTAAVHAACNELGEFLAMSPVRHVP